MYIFFDKDFKDLPKKGWTSSFSINLYTEFALGFDISRQKTFKDYYTLHFGVSLIFLCLDISLDIFRRI